MRGDFTEILPFPQISYVQQIHVVYRKTCSKRKLYRVHIHIYGTLGPCCLKQSWNNNTGIISRNWNSIKLMALDRIWLSKSSNIWSLLQSFFPCSRKNEFYGFFFEEEFSDTGFVVNNKNDNALVQSQCKLLTLQKACVKY